ncbi:MAG: hypothetical protein M1825_000700 [Sarcosagium campestre]|nr:MAG: hypothetical protein M1825_000700 [Sarcosagium campestre]
MAPTAAITLLSPAELSFLHSSLSLSPPVRPDLREASQFRPLVVETDFLPGANGSARVCFADGSEAVVGVKAEVQRAADGASVEANSASFCVEMTVDLPGYRDDDALPVFLAAMLNEALLASGDLPRRLRINSRFYWKIHVDILLLSAPLSYPLPLLSLTTHLALLSARLPRLKSELEEDPLFDDDWEASVHLYPRSSTDSKVLQRPPVTLLVMALGDNILFDPTREELAVADAVLAVSVGETGEKQSSGGRTSRELMLLSVRTIDPPSRLTTAGVPNAINPATGGTLPSQDAVYAQEVMEVKGVWRPPRGGPSRAVIKKIIRQALEPGGPAEEVFDGLEAVEVG